MLTMIYGKIQPLQKTKTKDNHPVLSRLHTHLISSLCLCCATFVFFALVHAGSETSLRLVVHPATADVDIDDEKVLVCHSGKGNNTDTDKKHAAGDVQKTSNQTLAVSPGAFSAHLDHGDRAGVCVGDDPKTFAEKLKQKTVDFYPVSQKIERIVLRPRADNPKVLEEVRESISGDFLEGEIGRMRVSNATDAGMLSVGVAPAGGDHAAWISSSGKTLELNNPHGAQLSVDLSAARLSALNGANTSNTTLPSGGTFSAGIVNSVTLFNTRESFAEFDLRGVKFWQSLPDGTESHEQYSLEMVITSI